MSTCRKGNREKNIFDQQLIKHYNFHREETQQQKDVPITRSPSSVVTRATALKQSLTSIS